VSRLSRTWSEPAGSSGPVGTANPAQGPAPHRESSIARSEFSDLFYLGRRLSAGCGGGGFAGGGELPPRPFRGWLILCWPWRFSFMIGFDDRRSGFNHLKIRLPEIVQSFLHGCHPSLQFQIEPKRCRCFAQQRINDLREVISIFVQISGQHNQLIPDTTRFHLDSYFGARMVSGCGHVCRIFHDQSPNFSQLLQFANLGVTQKTLNIERELQRQPQHMNSNCVGLCTN
jgi:hypothetical protein